MLNRADLLKVHPVAVLNKDGQCCGRKPIPYVRDPHLFCGRCDRAFGVTDGIQIPNWAWLRCGDGFIMTETVAAAKVAGELWKAQPSSGLDTETFRNEIVHNDIESFRTQYRETFAHG